MQDPNDRISGWLLSNYFPEHLSTNEVARHFREPKSGTHFGTFEGFWSHDVFQRLNPDQTADLADLVVNRYRQLNASPRRFSVQNSTLRWALGIVATALERSNSPPPAARLAEWLSITMDHHGSSIVRSNDSDIRRIAAWLEAHPKAMHGLYKEELRSIDEADFNHRRLWRCDAILQGATYPPDWGQRLLAMTEEYGDTEIGAHCFRQAWNFCRSTVGSTLSGKQLKAWVSDHQTQLPQAAGWLVQCERFSKSMLRQQRARERVHERQAVEEMAANTHWVKSHWPAMLSNQGDPKFLAELARAWEADAAKIANQEERAHLQELLAGMADHEPEAIAALARTLRRHDLPEPDEIIATWLEGRAYDWIAIPFLAAARMDFEANGNSSDQWDDLCARRAVAFKLTSPTGNLEPWYAHLATQRPMLVASVLLRFAVPGLQDARRKEVPGIWDLPRAPAMAEVARLVLPELLTEFPARARPVQLTLLSGALLNAAMLHMPEADLFRIANHRRAIAGSDAMQKLLWVIVCLPRAPRQRGLDLLNGTRTSQARSRRLADLLDSTGFGLSIKLPSTGLAALINILGPHAQPKIPLGVRTMNARNRRGDLVRSLINQLAACSDPDAENRIQQLRKMPTLLHWYEDLADAQHELQRKLRIERFGFATWRQVAKALDGGTPLNPQDLAATLIDELESLQLRIRHREGSGVEVFWRDPDPVEGLRIPRVENVCRDRLMERLLDPLERKGIILRPEDQHANETRADLTLWAMCNHHAFRMPVEIKCESHSKVWTAWADQLQRYANSPEAAGVGLYLVLWFGLDPRLEVSRRTGTKPASASQLQARLQARVAASNSQGIRVFVLDLSLPEANARKGKNPKKQVRQRA